MPRDPPVTTTTLSRTEKRSSIVSFVMRRSSGTGSCRRAHSYSTRAAEPQPGRRLDSGRPVPHRRGAPQPPDRGETMDLTDHVVIVTGSTSGIGEAIARRLAGAGARVVVNSARSVEAGEALAAELGDATYVQGDIADPE